MPLSTQTVRCALGMQRVLWPIFTFSLLFYFFHVPFFCKRWECLCVKPQRMMGGGAGTEPGWPTRQHLIGSWNVVLMFCRGGGGGGGGGHTDRPAQSQLATRPIRTMTVFLHPGASRIIWSIIGVYFSIVCDFEAVESIAESFRSFFCSFLFSLDHTTCRLLAWLLCTGNKHVERIFDMICLGQNRAFFLHRGLWFSGYSVYLQMLPFCILQRVSKHCVAMLILLNLHWQAALMVFFMCSFGYSLCLWPLTVLDDKQLVVTM